MAKDSVYSLSAFNKYGDVVAHWKNDGHKYSEQLKTPCLGEWNFGFFSYLIGELVLLQKRGVYIIMCPPVMSDTAYKNNRLNIEYTDSMLRTAGFGFVEPQKDMVFPDTLFYDTGYHLRRVGAEKHSLYLMKLLRNRCEMH